MKYRGIVEGYYGKLLSFEDRKIHIDLMSENQLNFYLYAPKEDPFLRSDLNLDHPKGWLEDFSEFVNYAKIKEVTIGVGLAPISNNKEHIYNKIELFYKSGVSDFSILFDDIENHFSLEAQLDIYQSCVLTFPECSFNYCPTVYSDELINKDERHLAYFSDFTANFPKDINFFWTGKNVISTSQSQANEDVFSNFSEEQICIWDNFFTIDSNPEKLNLTDCHYIDKSYLASKHLYLINLTGLLRTDSLIIEIFGNFVSNSNIAFEKILSKHGVDEGLINMKDLFNPAVDINLSEKEMNKIHNIMFSWFHPLKNEWYPYLHNLKNWGKK